MTEPSRRQYQSRPSQPSRQRRSLTLFCLTVFLATIFIIGGIYAWRWMEKPTSFPIKAITVEGKLTHESPVAIQHIMLTKLTGGFFSLHVFAAKQALLAFPWVADVSFRRVWPHTVIVKIAEQQAITRFGKNGVLNSAGDVFYPDAKSLPQNLPDLEGPVDQSKTLFNFYQTVNTLAHVLGLSVISLHVNTYLHFQIDFLSFNISAFGIFFNSKNHQKKKKNFCFELNAINYKSYHVRPIINSTTATS